MKNNYKQTFHSPVLTDGGLETTLIFNHNIDLPHFASFCLLDKPNYQQIIYEYYCKYLDLAKKYQTGFILESATWRANADWGHKLGYSNKNLVAINQRAIKQLKFIKEVYQKEVQPILISGCIGPRMDGYTIRQKMTAEEAQDYHDLQIATFKKAEVDMVSALTINYVDEGLGIVKSAMNHQLPVIISFTVETDGHLPSQESLKKAIETIDYETDNYPKYYMINCAHPSHFADQLDVYSEWALRLGGIRANASCKSHAELDESTELDAGETHELASWYQSLKTKLPNLMVYGGCCGTDVEHIEAICEKNIRTQ